MVHRKSEYRLQYHFLPENIRKQIWEDNANLRSCRKVLNQAHHYWEYQLTEKDQCDCDGEDEYDPGPPPPHKLKHKTLLAQYGTSSSNCSNDGDDKTSKMVKSKSCINFNDQSKLREIAVQTPNWKRRNDSTSTDSGRESDAASEELKNVMRNMSSLSLPEVQQNESSDTNISNKNNPVEKRPSTPVPPPSPALIVQGTSASAPNIRNNRSQSRPPSGSRQRSSPPQRSRTPCPTRTNRKLYQEGKKTHFVPFGWNNSDIAIGKKKTFNVCAPQKEVHEVAVDAAKRKQEEIQKFISDDMSRHRHRNRTPFPMCSFSNSIWTSEYKEQFCRQRPTSAPPPPR